VCVENLENIYVVFAITIRYYNVDALVPTEKSLYLSSFPPSFRSILKPSKAPHAPHHKRTEIKVFTRGWARRYLGNLLD